ILSSLLFYASVSSDIFLPGMHMADVSLPLLPTFIFALLLLLSWVGGAAMTAQNFRLAMQVQADLLEQVKELRTRCDILQQENNRLREQNYETDARLRVALSRVDELSADLAVLQDDTRTAG
ncbi:MAG: hypothetical protein D6784_14975, partial [Chloroflexi bacterium]